MPPLTTHRKSTKRPVVATTPETHKEPLTRHETPHGDPSGVTKMHGPSTSRDTAEGSPNLPRGGHKAKILRARQTIPVPSDPISGGRTG